MEESFGQFLERSYGNNTNESTSNKIELYTGELPELLIKLAEGATMPSRANDTDTGYDLTATSVRYDEEYGFLEYGTGVFMHIPDGYEVKVFPRSSISKYDLFLCNAVGVIDEQYRQEVKLRYKTTYDYDVARLDANGGLICFKDITYSEGITPRIYQIGDKIGQFEMKKKDLYTVKQVGDISETGRGGFGSDPTHSAIYNMQITSPNFKFTTGQYRQHIINANKN